MKLYSVIPISRSLAKETLSYFGGDQIEIGSLVSVPLRRKIVKAVVVDGIDVEKIKTEIKKSTFTLKKIRKTDSKKFLSSAFLKAANQTALLHASNTGLVLEKLIPSLVMENVSRIDFQSKPRQGSLSSEKTALQAGDEERFAQYRGFIRGQFARDNSVYICLPTIEDVRYAKSSLEKGIEKYTIAFHSKLTKKEFLKALLLLKNESHPLLIVGTVPFLSLERKDLGSIVLEKESSRAYRTQLRPFLDLRVFARVFASARGIPILFGDHVLSIETLWKIKTDEYSEFVPIKMRALSSAENILVDMKRGKNEEKKEFAVLSQELVSLIDTNIKENEHMFLWTARRGLSPSVVCGDCGKAVSCKTCSSPVTLFSEKSKRNQSENFFLCNKCGESRSAAEKCKYCDSWKLTTLGIGIELVEKEIKKLFPNVKLFRLDKDTTESEKRARETVEKWRLTPGSILLGTELALFYLRDEIENVAVVSIDSLFSIPDYRMNEKIFSSLLSIRAKAQKVFLVQTRNADNIIFDLALKGNIVDFYKKEIEERKMYGFSPFSTFIKLSIEGKGTSLEDETKKIGEFLSDFDPKIYRAFSPSKRGNPVWNILIIKKPYEWPDQLLLEKIFSLPQNIAVRVDPESLL